MTRCYEYYCLYKNKPEKCDLDRMGDWRVRKYMKLMEANGVQFSGQPTDKGLFYAASEKLGSEWAAIGVSEPIHAGEFRPEVYDIWRFDKRAPQFGKADYSWGLIAGQIVQNLVHYYTEVNDLVLDPMAGSGTTIDVCQSMHRRWVAYDLAPARPDILPNDLVEGPPPISEPAQLVILDPPYFQMKHKDAYTSYAQYLAFLEAITKHAAQVVRPGGYLALILMDQVNKEQMKFSLVGPAYQFLGQTGFHYEHLIGLPLSSQQFQAYDVTRAREDKTLLGVNRQMWVFRRPV